jgi:methionyl-tRNA synthetase
MQELPERIQQTLQTLIPDAAEAAARKAEAKAIKHAKETAVSDETKEETPRISIDDFFKVELRAGKVLSAEAHPNADRLLVLQVDIGEPEPRNIVAGIAAKYSPDELVGKQVVIVANLKPAKLRGVVSEGMLLACGGKAIEGLVTVDPECAPGAVVR